MYGHEERMEKARTGPPLSGFDYYPNTKTYIDKSAVHDPRRYRVYKKNKYKANHERAYTEALTKLRGLNNHLHLPKHIVMNTFFLYKKVHHRQLVRGRSIMGFLGACLYYSCRVHHYPIFYNDILKLGDGEADMIRHCLGLLLEKFNLTMPPIDYKSYIPRVISKCGLGFWAEKELRNLLEQLPRQFFTGRSPRTVFGALVYIACKKNDIHKRQKEVADALDITAQSMRYTYRRIADLVGISPTIFTNLRSRI
jgi:transcription initiation factor TFIIIB Brf1 subunit/transcription initiation factor TFIIB